jgi:hypothetical protein
MYADGLALKFRNRPALARTDDKKTSYMEGLSPIERVRLCARVGYKLAKHTLHNRADATT